MAAKPVHAPKSVICFYIKTLHDQACKWTGTGTLISQIQHKWLKGCVLRWKMLFSLYIYIHISSHNFRDRRCWFVKQETSKTFEKVLFKLYKT